MSEGIHWNPIEGLGFSAREDLRRWIWSLPYDDLAQRAFDAEWRSARDRLRRAARLEGISADQLAMFEVHRSIPLHLRIEIDGEETFVRRDVATLAQILENEEWAMGQARARVGIHERRLKGLLDFEATLPTTFDRYAGFEEQVYRDVLCSVCAEGWREADPFEWAHDEPVAFGGGDNAVQLAHRSCNRAEGA